MRVLATGLSMLVLSAAASAQGIQNAIHVRADQTLPLNQQTGADWQFAYKDLQVGIDAAIASMGQIVDVVVKEGMYVPSTRWDLHWDNDGQTCDPNTNNDSRAATFLVQGLGASQQLAIHGGFLGTENALNPNSPEGSFNQTILTGDIQNDGQPQNNAYHVVVLDSTNIAQGVTLDGFRVTGGFAEKPGVASHVIWSDRGGGILSVNMSCRLTNLRVRDNYAFAAGGGICGTGELLEGEQGVDCPGRQAQLTSIEVTRSVIRDNSTDGAGGGIFFGTHTDAGMGNLRIFDNFALAGGGVAKAAEVEPDFETLTGYNVVMYDNTAAAGGAIRIDDGVTTKLSQCTIAYNWLTTPALRGGGIDLDALVQNSKFEVENSVVYWNGGYDIAVMSALPGNTVAANFCDLRVFSGSLNVASGTIFVDPKFVDGPGRNLRFASAIPPGGSPSPCIDRGSPMLRPTDDFNVDEDAQTGEPLDVDLDLGPRVIGTAIDMGAYEAAPVVYGT